MKDESSYEHAIEVLAQAEAEEAAAKRYRRRAAEVAGAVLLDLRKQHKLSMLKAAKRLGISAPYLRDMEQGRRCTNESWLREARNVYPLPAATFD